MPKAKTIDEIVWKPLKDLIPYHQNMLDHGDDQINRLASIIAEHGFDVPIVIDENNIIIKGHGRRLAALKLGWKEGPVIIRSDLTSSQVKALRISDNAIAYKSEINVQNLTLELEQLKEQDFDLELTGYNEEEIEKFLSESPNWDDDEEFDNDLHEPIEEAEPRVKLGDIWKLGKHYVMCGDSTDKSDRSKLLGNKKITLVVTDPPYGVNYDNTWRHKEGKHNHGKAVLNDHKWDFCESIADLPCDVFYVWHAGLYTHKIGTRFEELGLIPSYLIIWNKNNMTFGRGDYHHKHEPLWYLIRKGCKHNWQGDRTQTTVWDIDHINSTKQENQEESNEQVGHSTQKPIECMRRPIVNNSAPGDLIFDPFLGSGTTLIASEKTDRVCYGMELSPVFCDIILARFQKLTGVEPKLIDNILKEN